MTPAPTTLVPHPAALPAHVRRLDARDVAVAAAFALASLALYAWLGQGILYGDGAEFMLLLHDGAAGHKNHLAYLPMLRACAALGHSFGWSEFESARACSQLGAALGVALFFFASRRFGLDRKRAAWLTALIASTPSVIFFATVVEVHAPYFAFLALAWLVTAHLVRGPSAARGACLGLACGLAYLGHASGFVLPAPLLLVAAMMHGRAGMLRAALACVATHAAVVTLVPWLASHTGHAASPFGAARFLMWWRVEVLERPGTIFLVLWNEWLLAYLPVSLLWLRAFVSLRRSAVLALVVLLPYLALSIALLAVYREFGAYQHAVLWLFTWLVVRTWSPGWCLAAVLVALAVGIWKVHTSDDRAPIDAYARGLATVSASAPPLLLVGDFADFAHCFVAQPDTEFENLAAPRYADAVDAAAALAHLDARIAAHRATGGRVFLTAGAVGFIASSATNAPDSGFAALFTHLQTRYRREFAGADGFRGFELLPLD